MTSASESKWWCPKCQALEPTRYACEKEVEIMKAWKQFEADAAALFKGKRFWANSGERLDFEGYLDVVDYDVPPGGAPGRKRVPVRGQCKLVRTLSLEALTRLAEEPGVDVVCVKVRRGTGRPSPALVVMTFENYRRLHG